MLLIIIKWTRMLLKHYPEVNLRCCVIKVLIRGFPSKNHHEWGSVNCVKAACRLSLGPLTLVLFSAFPVRIFSCKDSYNQLFD